VTGREFKKLYATDRTLSMRSAATIIFPIDPIDLRIAADDGGEA
jgi:hypothetical protein